METPTTMKLKNGNPNTLIFKKYPRQFGKSRKVVYSQEEFNQNVNEMNGKTAVYSSVYECSENNKFNDIELNTIYYDFDGGRDGFVACREFHRYLVDEGIMHIVVHSGSGMNIHVASDDPEDRKFPARDVLYNAQTKLLTNCFGTKKFSQLVDDDIIDSKIIGDKARICRVMNTFNVKNKAKRFCIPLKKDDIIKGWEQITSKAESQVNEWHVFGDHPVDLSKFDEAKDDVNFVEMEFEEVDLDEVNTEDDNWLKFLPPIIQKLLFNQKSGYKDRYYTILAMKESGLPLELTREITKKYWTNVDEHMGRMCSDWEHARRDERQFRYVYSRDNLLFPDMNTLKAKGYPVNQEDYEWHKELYR